MARVLKLFPEPDDPRKPPGSLRRAVWRTVKGSWPSTSINPRLFILAGIVWMLWALGMPHLRASYQYVGPSDGPIYTRCDYLGWEPFITRGPECPLVVFRPWKL